ncbi:MAG TPA: DUF1214 domain-containing protein [Rhizomicrobium sp.]|jgi:hypothetical protein
MHIALKLAAAVVIGTVLGLFVTWLVVFENAMPGGVSDGPWRTNLSIGSAAGDIRTRAAVALHGLLALDRKETLYYTAGTDSTGAALSGACTYRVTGRDPDARWWSITAYGPDDYLIPNPGKHYSVSKNSVTHAADGSFQAIVSAMPAPTNWIALTPGAFTLTLRLYNPGAKAAADPAHATLPAIAKESCR